MSFWSDGPKILLQGVKENEIQFVMFEEKKNGIKKLTQCFEILRKVDCMIFFKGVELPFYFLAWQLFHTPKHNVSIIHWIVYQLIYRPED